MAAALRLQSVRPEVLAAVKRLELTTQQKIALVAEAMALEVVAYLRSLTAETRPPAKAGEGWRYAHPGHWADITGQLANSYDHYVAVVAGGVVVAFVNYAEYARHLEQHDGYFVLSGVTAPGGPVEVALVRVAKAFGWVAV